MAIYNEKGFEPEPYISAFASALEKIGEKHAGVKAVVIFGASNPSFLHDGRQFFAPSNAPASNEETIALLLYGATNNTIGAIRRTVAGIAAQFHAELVRPAPLVIGEPNLNEYVDILVEGKNERVHTMMFHIPARGTGDYISTDFGEN
jgi:hypothetical protein